MAKYRAAHPDRVIAFREKYKFRKRQTDALWRAENKEKTRAKNARLYAANREKVMAQHAAWRAANPERYRQSILAWRTAHPENARAASLKWQRANREKMSARYREWRIANRAHNSARGASRRAREKRATPVWANHFFIEEAYDLAQLRTKATGFKWHVDHIVPLISKRVCGLHVENNLQVIPATTNASKGNRHWPDMPSEMRI